MSEKKFTPGPWVSNPRTILYGGMRAEDGYVINALGGERAAWYGLAQVVTETEDGDRNIEGVANAKLIAAAPDLYDALELTLQACYSLEEYQHNVLGDDSQYQTGSLIEQAKAALAKARGEA